MAELKPCPFCGDKPHIDREEIFCNMCGAKMPFPFYEWGIAGEGDFPEYKIARQEAIERWNSRRTEDG